MVIVMLLTSCTLPEQAALKADELLVDISMFPGEWTVRSEKWSASDKPHVLQDQDAEEFVGIGFAPPDWEFGSRVSSGHVIWNFGSSSYARSKFSDRFMPDDLDAKGYFSALDYTSKVADRFGLYCRIVEANLLEGRWIDCIAVGQYGSLISVFNAPIGTEFNFTEDDFKQVLMEIDNKMDRYNEEFDRITNR
jgi:hypothetical protein